MFITLKMGEIGHFGAQNQYFWSFLWILFHEVLLKLYLMAGIKKLAKVTVWIF